MDVSCIDVQGRATPGRALRVGARRVSPGGETAADGEARHL